MANFRMCAVFLTQTLLTQYLYFFVNLNIKQEEALFVSTSSALQNKMEKVEQQLTSNSSMNGYHIGHHLKNNKNNNSVSASPPKCPMASVEQQQQQQNNSSKQQQQTLTAQNSKQDDNGNIASAYFQAKYG